MAKRRITQTTSCDKPKTLVFCEIPIGSPQQERQIQVEWVGDFRPISRCISETVKEKRHKYHGRLKEYDRISSDAFGGLRKQFQRTN